MSGLLAGAQGALLSLLVVTTPALAAYVATSADPSNAEVGWSRSVVVGSVLWLMGHGASVRPGGVDVSVIPLGLTVLVLFCAYASARRSAHRAVSAWLAGIGGHALVVTVVVLLTGQSGPLGAGVGSVLRTVLGTAVIAGLGLGAGTVRMRRIGELARPWWEPVPVLVRRSGTAAVMVVAMLVGVASVITGAWVLAGRAAADDVVVGLGVDAFGGVILAVAQLSVLPNLVLWVVGWLAGPGFAVGAGTVYAPSEVVSAPLPALPLLGALPPAGTEGGPLVLVPIVVVLAGAVAGWWLHRRLPTRGPGDVLGAVLSTGLWAGAVTAALMVLAGGAAGPGRLATVGASPLVVGAAVAGLVIVGSALTAVPTDVHVRAAVVRGARRAWRREGAVAKPSDPAE